MLSGTAAAEQDKVARLTSEMTKAIKRQEPNSGLDYWRTSGMNNVGYVATEKRPTYKKVTQINLNFPGASLPNLNPGPQNKPRRREHPASAIVLTRSRSSLTPKVNTRSHGGSNISILPASKKTMVTDLTCLQLADTLFSSRKAPYAGLLNFWPGRARYTDYFMDGKESNADESNSDTLSDICLTKQKQNPNNSQRRGTSIPVLHYKTLPAEEEVLQNNREHFNNGAIPNSPVSSCTEGSGSYLARKDSKPHKSILKNGSLKNYASNSIADRDTQDKPEQGACATNTCSYQLPSSTMERQRQVLTDRIVSLDTISPKLQYTPSRPGSNKSDSVTSSNLEYALDGLMNDLSTKKRSVRFNSIHEIREYAPCEPISYC